MATDAAGQRYQKWYAMLLRLYPRPFQEKFGEGMAQTFHDLCREHAGHQRGLHGLALGIFLETSAGIVMENTIRMPQLVRTMLRVALGALAALMVPLVASRVVQGWNWPAGTFVFVYVLFFATGMVYALVARKMKVWSYKTAVGIALVTGFALGWSNMVHVADSENPANLVYYSVLVIGAVGAWRARLEARGLALTLFAMAATLALIALILPSGAPADLARNMAIGHGAFVVLLTGSGLLFQHASTAEMK